MVLAPRIFSHSTNVKRKNCECNLKGKKQVLVDDTSLKGKKDPAHPLTATRTDSGNFLRALIYPYYSVGGEIT